MGNISNQTIKNQSNLNESSIVPDIGLCVKIENSNKTFQVVGLNNRKSICWIRELPLEIKSHKTFALSINQVMALTICPCNSINEETIY